MLLRPTPRYPSIWAFRTRLALREEMSQIPVGPFYLFTKEIVLRMLTRMRVPTPLNELLSYMQSMESEQTCIHGWTLDGEYIQRPAPDKGWTIDGEYVVRSQQ